MCNSFTNVGQIGFIGAIALILTISYLAAPAKYEVQPLFDTPVTIQPSSMVAKPRYLINSSAAFIYKIAALAIGYMMMRSGS